MYDEWHRINIIMMGHFQRRVRKVWLEYKAAKEEKLARIKAEKEARAKNNRFKPKKATTSVPEPPPRRVTTVDKKTPSLVETPKQSKVPTIVSSNKPSEVITPDTLTTPKGPAA